MTVSSTLNKQIYVGNGTTKTFDYTFYTLAESDLKLYLTNITTGVETEITANYDISPTGDAFPANSGIVTYPVVGDPITSNYKFVIIRKLNNLQPTIYPNNTSLKPKIVETSLDRLTMITQQLAEETDRSFKVSIYSPAGISAELPIPVPGAYFKWDPTGTEIVNGSSLDSKSIDGGNASSVYLDIQTYNGGDANG